MRISGWSSDVCSSDLLDGPRFGRRQREKAGQLAGVVPPATLFCSTIGAVNLIKGDDVAHVRLLQLSGAGSASHSGWSSAMGRSEEHTSELQSLMRISYAVFCLKKKNNQHTRQILGDHNNQ